MLMILSPAKTFKLIEEPLLNLGSDLVFSLKTKMLIEQLQRFSPEELSKLMKMSESLGEVNASRFSSFYEKNNQAMLAIHAFEGEAYKGLDSKTLDDDALTFSQESLRILSGLYGVLRPTDAMNPYRLEMGLSFSGEHGKNLYTFWKDELTTYFLDELNQTKGDQVLINLASGEYSKAINLKAIEKQYRVVTIEFKEKKEAGYKVVGMYAKRARGQMARYILKQQLHEIEKLKAFNEDSYQFNAELSSDNTWIFTR